MALLMLVLMVVSMVSLMVIVRDDFVDSVIADGYCRWLA